MQYWICPHFVAGLSSLRSSDDKSAVVKEYKEEIETLKKEKDAIAKKLGEVIVERDWAVGKLQSLDLSIKRKIVNKEGNVQTKTKEPSLNKRLKMLGISKTAYYYKPVIPFSSNNDKKLLSVIDKIYTNYPYYGTRRMVVELKKKSFNVGRKLVKKLINILVFKHSILNLKQL